jgi:hypothetical protein
MIEQGILEHPIFPKTQADENIAEVFVAPPFEFVFQFGGVYLFTGTAATSHIQRFYQAR